MSPVEIVAILVLVSYAIYRQTRVTVVDGRSRFKLAIGYGIVGLCVGGFAVPHGDLAVGLLVLSIALSAGVGVARGYRTRLWTEPDGTVWSQGTVLTVTLFLALVATKFAIGSVLYVEHVPDGAGFGEVMIMIAVMVAVQAEIIWRRAHSYSTAGDSKSATWSRAHSA